VSLLDIQNLTKTFGGIKALDAVELYVEEGSVHGLMGANGAGKTTLFSIVAGNQSLTSGTSSFAGTRIDGKRPDQICHAGIARTFQIVRPFSGMTVRQNVEIAVLFGRKQTPVRGEIAGITDEILTQCGLIGLSDQSSGTLTLATRKRLEVARALGTDPKLLMLDEVMAGLTPTEVDDMITALLTLKDRMGLTILIIEHVMSALNRMSDCITVLHHGQLIAHGTAKTISANPAIAEAYFGTDDGDEETD
jgi:branched-chain amino acid transport system ATP-binding protein